MISPVPRKAWGAGTPSSRLCPAPPLLCTPLQPEQRCAKGSKKKKKLPKSQAASWLGNSSLGNWGVLLQAAFPCVQVPEEENPVQLGLVASSR